MARINIEDTIYRDERFHRLSAFEGKFKALGLCVAAWDLAHRWFLRHPEGLIPLAEWDASEELKLLEKYGLAERRENGIYVKGSSTQCQYLTKRSAAGKKGGLKSQENFSSKTKQIEQNQPSSSSSFSGIVNTRNIVTSDDATPPPAEPQAQEASGINSPPSESKNAALGWPLDLIYQEYPKRLGATGKAAGMKRLDRIIKNLDDFDLALEAVKRYARHCQAQGNTGTGFVKMFSSFWDPRGDWKEWATMEEVKEKQQPTVNGMVVVGKAQMKI